MRRTKAGRIDLLSKVAVFGDNAGVCWGQFLFPPHQHEVLNFLGTHIVGQKSNGHSPQDRSLNTSISGDAERPVTSCELIATYLRSPRGAELLLLT
jgi:hypothetical protein